MARKLVMFTEGPGNWLYGLADQLGWMVKLLPWVIDFMKWGLEKLLNLLSYQWCLGDAGNASKSIIHSQLSATGDRNPPSGSYSNSNWYPFLLQLPQVKPVDTPNHIRIQFFGQQTRWESQPHPA